MGYLKVDWGKRKKNKTHSSQTLRPLLQINRQLIIQIRAHQIRASATPTWTGHASDPTVVVFVADAVVVACRVEDHVVGIFHADLESGGGG